jgi:ABC-type bacteriocin/lantibiotic exporter with double-glycine peptidase domain
LVTEVLACVRVEGFPLAALLPSLSTLFMQFGRFETSPLLPGVPRVSVHLDSSPQFASSVYGVSVSLPVPGAPLISSAPGQRVLVLEGPALNAWCADQGGEHAALALLYRMQAAKDFLRRYVPWAEMNNETHWTRILVAATGPHTTLPRETRGLLLPQNEGSFRPWMPSTLQSHAENTCSPFHFIAVPEGFLRSLLSELPPFLGPSNPALPEPRSPGKVFLSHPFAALMGNELVGTPGVEACLRAAAALLSHPLPSELFPSELQGPEETSHDLLRLGDFLERAGLRTFSCSLEKKSVARLETPFLFLEDGCLAVASPAVKGRVLVGKEGWPGVEERVASRLTKEGEGGRVPGLLLWSSEMFRPDELADALAGDDDEDDNDARKVTKKMVRKRLGRMVAGTLEAGLPLLVNRFLLATLAMGIGLLVPALSQGIIDRAFSSPSLHLAGVIAATLAGVLLVQFLLYLLSEFLWSRLQWRLSTRFDGVVYRQIFRSLPDWKDTLGPGLSQAWLREAEQLKTFLMRDLPTFLTELLTVLAVFLILISKSPALGLLPAGGFAICFLAWYFYRSTIRRNETSGFLLSAATGNLLLEQVRGMETIRSLTGSRKLIADWQALATESARRDVNIARQQSALDTFTGGVALVCEAFSLAIICLLAARGERTVGEVVSVAMYISLLFAPMSNLTSFYDRYRKCRAAFKRLLDLFMTSRDELAAERPTFARPHFGSLRFEGVRLQVRDGRRLGLGEGAFVVLPEERVVIYGAEGSGKSQLARLLALRTPPDQGRVLLDDRPLANPSLRTIAMHVALVQRTTHPLGSSLAELLTYGTSRGQAATLERLCAWTGLDEALEESGLSMAARTQEHGAPLPENVLQLCTLVRILLGNPRIVVLDDALSGLSPRQERETLERLFTNLPQITFLVLTRREELLSLRARRFRLEGGEPREEI